VYLGQKIGVRCIQDKFQDADTIVSVKPVHSIQSLYKAVGRDLVKVKQHRLVRLHEVSVSKLIRNVCNDDNNNNYYYSHNDKNNSNKYCCRQAYYYYCKNNYKTLAFSLR